MKSRRVALLACLLAAGGLGIVVVCGGVVSFGLQIVAEQVRRQLEADPQFSEHVGQVQEFQTEFLASMMQPEGVRIYGVKGSKWSGRITVNHVTDNSGDEQVIWARFTLPSGEIVELRPE